MTRFPDHARVCFVGDSLMAQNKHIPRIIDFYNEKFPDSDITFYNCGVSGGTAKFQYNYFEKNIMSHKPTHIVFSLGINDSMRDLLREPKSKERYARLCKAYEEYKKWYRLMCERITGNNIELTVCTPAPHAEYQKTEQEALRGGYALMLGYAQYVRNFAAEKGYPLCDYHSYLTELMIIQDFNLPDSEKIKIVEKYVSEEGWNKPEYIQYFEEITRAYLTDNIKEKELFDEIERITIQEIKGHKSQI